MHLLLAAPFYPKVFTDCLSPRTALSAGRPKLTAAGTALAGMWRTLFDKCTESAFDLLDKLVWLPAHLSLRSALRLFRSDGCKVTVQDWRANRLVDGFAKRCALGAAIPRRHANALDEWAELMKHEAAVLGACTFAANNHVATRIVASGDVVKCTLRDAEYTNSRPAGSPARPWRQRVPPAPPTAPELHTPSTPRTVLRPHSERAKSSAAAAKARTRAVRATDGYRVACIVTENALSRSSVLVSSSLDSRDGLVDKFEAIRARVRARNGGSVGQDPSLVSVLPPDSSTSSTSTHAHLGEVDARTPQRMDVPCDVAALAGEHPSSARCPPGVGAPLRLDAVPLPSAGTSLLR